MFFAHEHISILQITGLVVILGSVLLINLSKYRKGKSASAGNMAEQGADEMIADGGATLKEYVD